MTVTHRTVIRWRSVPLGLLCGALLAAGIGLAARLPAQQRTMDVKDVKPGMKGYGLTVFSGTKPQRFDVEIISTLHNFRPGQDLFIVKTPHPRLNIARTVAGMSGSPIFINDKLIGAYAYGWYFNVEPIAGVTPIKNMLEDLRRPVPPALHPSGPSGLLPGAPKAAKQARRPSSSRNRFRGKLLDYDLRKHATQVANNARPSLAAPAGSRLRAASTDVMVGGLSQGAVKLARALLEPVGMRVLQAGTGGGKATTTAAKAKYVDGGVITVQLVRGDMSISGLGTVTHVVGDKLVAFGHPMMNGGIEQLPTALGTVHWILSTQNRSFKIGEPTQPLGTLVNDRQASIVVDTTRVAPTFPITVDIAGAPGAPKTKWRMEGAHDQFLSPSIIAMAIGSALQTTSGERNDMTWRAVSKMQVDGHGTLTLNDFGAGSRVPAGPSTFARSRVVRAAGALLNNPWEISRIRSVETKLKVMHKRDVLQLRGTQVLEQVIDAGKPARLRLTLQAFHGKQINRTVEVPIPRSLAGRTVQIKLQPAYTVDRIVAAPENIGDLVRALGSMDFPGEALIASYRLPKQASAAINGNVALRLPPGAVDTLRTTSQTIKPQLYAATKQVVIPLKGFLTGQDTVEVKVRKVIR